ncbi:hypothetical protein K227x_61860 [Rubripirellula lacrimiformis]|uniref:Uncharacterized protein n=1 Tax=Rubripirellula lacrimiformis TaxID=1930273 RepID=A0A517NKT2_9BACT|nr:hypothetical protein [Rubripirellula lacrimiformis]QDT07758.1 hypothetical protein K227x_61860 [Rubripirellula lacrimiformis]
MKILIAILMCVFATTVDADEPWMYPVAIASSPTNAELHSAMTKQSFAADRDGIRSFECTTRVVDANVASFQEIVKWYADLVGETQLVNTLNRFVAEGKPGPGIGFFQTTSMSLSTHLAFRFMPDQKQITILRAEDDGDVVAISLLGLERETSIQVLRHHPSSKAVAQDSGERSDAPGTLDVIEVPEATN